ncbi:hypothetical protein RUM43_015077 [Polyplax serrata]|uniref:Rhabdovirus nucleocapsid domain-containing protein n=2 Tax=Polyplax serrata TaxID=468196 RepID=A0AAN8RXK9_POLSC
MATHSGKLTALSHVTQTLTFVEYATRKVWDTEVIRTDRAITYPQNWLKGSQKPTVTISYGDKSLKELSEDCHVNYQSGTLNLAVVKAFLIKFAEQHITQNLAQSWSPNNRVVGRAGDIISPVSLLDVQFSGGGGDLATTHDIIDLESLVGGILLIYRCIRVPSIFLLFSGGSWIATARGDARAIRSAASYHAEYDRRQLS